AEVRTAEFEQVPALDPGQGVAYFIGADGRFHGCGRIVGKLHSAQTLDVEFGEAHHRGILSDAADAELFRPITALVNADLPVAAQVRGEARLVHQGRRNHVRVAQPG